MLLVGGGLTTAMAAYHFFLPIQFQWARYVESIPAQIQWGLFAINFFFSVSLGIAGLTVVAIACFRLHTHPPGLWVVGGSFSFWAVNLGYLLVYPMPLPDTLLAVRIALFAYSGLAVFLHGIPTALYIRRTNQTQ